MAPWTGYDDVGFRGLGAAPGGGSTTQDPTLPACRQGFVAVRNDVASIASGQRITCCAADDTIDQWLKDNGYSQTCFQYGQEPVVAAVADGTDLGLIAYERVSSTTPPGTRVTAAQGLLKGTVQTGGYVAWDWNNIGRPGMNCSGQMDCNAEGSRLLAAMWAVHFPADDHGYCKGSDYPLPGYASYQQVPLVPCVPKKYASPVPATADYVATHQALLDAQHARGFPADQIDLFAAGKQSFVRFINLSQTGSHPEDTVNGQHGHWDLSGWNVHYGTNTDGKLLVVNLPDFYPDGGISLWDGLQAAFPLVVLAVKGAVALGELGLELFRAVLCNPVGKALAAAGVGIEGGGTAGAAGTVAVLNSLCALAGSGGGQPPIPCPTGQKRGADGFCTASNVGWWIAGAVATVGAAMWWAFGKDRK